MNMQFILFSDLYTPPCERPHAVADGKQELESRIIPVIELGQAAIT